MYAGQVAGIGRSPADEAALAHAVENKVEAAYRRTALANPGYIVFVGHAGFMLEPTLPQRLDR
jgi:hypothetical protein